MPHTLRFAERSRSRLAKAREQEAEQRTRPRVVEPTPDDDTSE